ncbi:MAG TPA: type II secretion system F family protein [Candidatus Dormibacteraeota bacterium]|jgi:tight adherence protein B|nr:type II secretion system F family protein [Candidatus Dormibacteraeota bacterium]
MPLIIVAVAAAAAAGVALVMYGIVSRNEVVATADIGRSSRVTYRTLADVREQLRRRFEPTGTPVWIAANQNVNPLAADLASADLQLRPYEFRLVQLGIALVFVIVAFLRFGVSIAVPVLGVIGYVLPAIYLRNRRGRRLRTFEAGLPRAMELIANSIKAGQSIAQALSSVTDNAGPPLNEEFGLARREIELGASVDSALSNMVKRMGSSDLRLVVMVITIQHSVGGDLPAILTTLADTMRQRAEMREEILAATAQSRASSLIVTLLPVAAAALLYFLVPDYFRPMFTSALGWVLIGISAGLLVIGNVIIRRITKIA